MLDETWTLGANVALRPEPFGALAYDFTTRRLSFLKTPELADVTRRLASSGTVRDALSAADVPASAWPSYVAALRGLAAKGMLTRLRATEVTR